jgi:uncharacterized protein
MAAAWPYCDAVVSAHNFESLDELLAALRAPKVQRTTIVASASAGAAGAAGASAGDAVEASARQLPPLSLPITRHFGRR